MKEYTEKEKKLLNYHNLMLTSLHFYNYLYSNKFNREDASILNTIPKDLYNRLILTQCALMLATYKDQFLVKNDLNINETGLNLILEPIMDLSKPISDKIECLNTLRHKLLHGDYYIFGDTITLDIYDTKKELNLNDLYECCSNLMLSTTTFKTKENIRRILSVNTRIIKKYGKITSVHNLKKIIKEFNIIECIDKPKNGFERDLQYLITLEKFYKAITDPTMNENNYLKKILEIEKKYIPLFAINNVDFELNIKKISDYNLESLICDIYFNNKKVIDDLPVDNQYTLLSNLIYTYIVDNHSDLLYASLLNNTKLLQEYIKRDDANVSNVDYKQLSVYYVDEMTIAAGIGAFYAIYQYGLDEILSSDLNVDKIINNETVDFTKFQLDVFNDNTMDKTLNIKKFQEKIDSINKEIAHANASLARNQSNFANYKEHAKAITPEKIKYFNKTEEEVKIKIAKHKLELEKINLFIQYKLDDYAKNYNIISHLRNAVAHGNVIIYPHIKGDTINDRLIEFNDIHEGRSTYKVVLKYQEFRTILNEENTSLVFKHVSGLLEPTVSEFLEIEKEYKRKNNPIECVKKLIKEFIKK